MKNTSTVHNGRYMRTAARMKPVSSVGIKTARTGIPRKTHTRRTRVPIKVPQTAVNVYKYSASNSKHLK